MQRAQDVAGAGGEELLAERVSDALCLGAGTACGLAHHARAVRHSHECLELERFAAHGREGADRHLAAALDDASERALGARRACGRALLEGGTEGATAAAL